MPRKQTFNDEKKHGPLGRAGVARDEPRASRIKSNPKRFTLVVAKFVLEQICNKDQG